MGNPTKTKHHLITYLIKLILPLIKVLPRGTLLFAGKTLGALVFRLSRRERNKVLTHLGIGLSEKSPEQHLLIAQRCFEHFASMVFEILHLKTKDIPSLFHEGELERMQKAFAAHDGSIAVCPHLGNWEMGVAAINSTSLTSVPIAKRIKMTPFNTLIEKFRAKLNVQVLYQDESMRSISKVLTRGDILGILPDQDIERMAGVFVSFLGAPAHTPTGPVQLASLTAKPMIPMACVLSGSKYRFLIGEPIAVPKKIRKEADLQHYTQCWSDELSGFIRQYPEQWAWMHRRWKTQQKAETKKETHGT